MYIISIPSLPPFVQAKTTTYAHLIATHKNILHRLWLQIAKTADVLRKNPEFCLFDQCVLFSSN